MSDAEIIKFILPYLLKIVIGLIVFQIIVVVLHLYYLNRCRIYLYDLTSALVSIAQRYKNNEALKNSNECVL